jgi:orotate phosphoribosyltransferase
LKWKNEDKKMNEDRIMKIFRETQALIQGHFRLSSGRHSDRYFQCAKVLQYPEHARNFGKLIAERMKDLEADAVISPAMGGIIIGYEVAAHLGVRSIFGERTEGVMALRRGFEIQAGERLIVIEDVITTGKSTMEVVSLVEGYGGVTVGIGCIADRSGGKAALPVPAVSLLLMEVLSWEASECPLCSKNIPVVYPGSRSSK